MNERRSRQAKATAPVDDAANGGSGGDVGDGAASIENRFSELHALGADVVDLLYTQAFSSHNEARTGEAICESFSKILLRHWDLCCILAFLQSDDGHLRESAVHTHPHLDREAARHVGSLLAARVEQTNLETGVFLDEEPGGAVDETDGDVRRALEAARLKCAVAVPIHARGRLVGALVAASASSERLREALKGVRFVAPPIVIALGNARRAAEMSEQHHHIEHLVEELSQRSAALEEANSELHRVGRYRSLFLARMSHELRTPLTSILGFAEILIDQEHLTDTQRRFCEKIQASGMHLHASVNQLVDLSRLEAGQTELFLHEFSLRETLRESCAAVGRLVQKQDAELDCQTAPELAVIVSDEGKLRQVLYNFFAYAIARSPAGGRIGVNVRTVAGDRFQIEITDEGEPLGDSTNIFEPVDLDAPSESGTNMNELGLVIAHRLVKVLGGTVTLDSAAAAPPGGGLRILLEFPKRPQESVER